MDETANPPSASKALGGWKNLQTRQAPQGR